MKWLLTFLMPEGLREGDRNTHDIQVDADSAPEALDEALRVLRGDLVESDSAFLVTDFQLVCCVQTEQPNDALWAVGERAEWQKRGLL